MKPLKDLKGCGSTFPVAVISRPGRFAGILRARLVGRTALVNAAKLVVGATALERERRSIVEAVAVRLAGVTLNQVSGCPFFSGHAHAQELREAARNPLTARRSRNLPALE